MYFREVESGNKKFELRKNDRNFTVGDYVVLREWNFSSYTGRAILAKITYILSIKELIKTKEEWVIFSITSLSFYQRYKPDIESGNT